MAVEITVDLSSVKDLQVQLMKVKKDAPKVLSRTLNRVTSTTRTAMKKEATSHYTIKSSEVLKTMRVYKASPARLSAKVMSVGGVVSLAHFKHKGYPVVGTDGKMHRGVKVKVKRSGRLAPTKPVHSSAEGAQPAFLVGKQGGNVIFRRTGKARLPIEKQSSLSIPQMISNPKSMQTIQAKTTENLQKRFDHEIKRELDRIRGGKKK